MKRKKCPGCKGTARRSGGVCRFKYTYHGPSICVGGYITSYDDEFEVIEHNGCEAQLGGRGLLQDEKIEIKFPDGTTSIETLFKSSYYSNDEYYDLVDTYISVEHHGAWAKLSLVGLMARRDFNDPEPPDFKTNIDESDMSIRRMKFRERAKDEVSV